MLGPAQLAKELPCLALGDGEEQARAVLNIVLEAVREAPPMRAVATNPTACPNCGKEVASTRSPYCGDECREIASFVRQFRAGLAKGWLSDREKQIALGQAFWHLMGGGRPLRITLIRPREIERVIQRDGGKCQVCGKPATTVDHIATGCNRPINLRAVCEPCSTAKPFGDPDVLDRSRGLLGELAARIAAKDPIRCSDDAETWDWRAHLRARSGR